MARQPEMKRIASLLLSFTVLVPLQLSAQMAGFNVSGDAGLMAGTQAPSGLYFIPSYYSFSADTLRDGNGDKVPPLLPGGSKIDSDAGMLGILWVSDLKIFGANYSTSIWPSITNNALEFPALPALGSKTSTGFGDLYLQPISLGWHQERADFLAGVGIYAPTGSFDATGSENRGLGMWGYEVFAGTTVYLDRARSWHLAALAAFETHGKKDGTNVRVGDIVSLEGGFGKSFMDGLVSAGITYYAQWKVSKDDLGLDYSLPVGPLFNKHRVYGFGAEVTIPIATRKKLYGFLNLRYIWETGAVQNLEGDSFMLSVSIPVPSIALQ